MESVRPVAAHITHVALRLLAAMVIISSVRPERNTLRSPPE